MKKIGLVFVGLLGLLTVASCSKKENVRFEISEDIKIELDEYDPKFTLRSLINVYHNEEIVDYSDLEVKLADDQTLSLGEKTFIVSYTYEGKEYTREFIVNFVDEYSNIQVHVFNETTTLRYKKDTNLSFLNQINIPSGFTLEGFYLDSSFTKELDITKNYTTDLEAYAKFSYATYSWKNVNADEVFDNLTSYIDSLMERTIDYVPAWNQEGFKGRWNYIDGVFLNSIVNLYTGTNDKRYKEFFLNYINGYINADGEFINLQKKEQSGYTSGELDTVCESRILFDAFDMTSDNRYLTALDYTYQELGKMPLASGTQNYSHKVSYPNQIWLDGMYMYVPFLARYALLKDKPEIFDTIKTQYEYIRNHMFDEEKKLYYHGHDTTKSVFWADKETGNSKSFWLRSNGWLIVSLVDVLEYYPAGENKEYLKGLLKEALEGILQYQDEDSKLFFQLVDLGKTAVIVPYEYLKSLKNTSYTKDSVIKNYLESSGSSMIAYSLMKAARLGYISSEYQQIGNDIFEGIYGYSYKNGSLENICITAGLGPENNAYRDGTAEYYLAEPVGKDDAKGVGPFLMAFLEYAMKHNKI